MTVLPGLSLPLKAVGKRVKGWDESGDCLQVEVNGAQDRKFKRTFFSQWPPGNALEHPLMRSLSSASAC